MRKVHRVNSWPFYAPVHINCSYSGRETVSICTPVFTKLGTSGSIYGENTLIIHIPTFISVSLRPPK